MPAGYRAHVLTLLAAGAVAYAIGIPAAQEPPQIQQTFRAGVELTVVEVTVRGREGRLLTGLGRSDFQVSERGRTLEVEQFSIDRQPVSAVLMVQTAGELDLHRDVATTFVDALGEGDRLAIGTYGLEVSVSPHLTADRTILRRVLAEELWPGWWLDTFPTAVVRSVAALPVAARRRAVIAVGLTSLAVARDGWLRHVSVGDARQAAIDAETMVYGVATGAGYDRIQGRFVDTWEPKSPGPETRFFTDGVMLDLAKETGGGYVRSKDLTPDPAWPRVAADALDEVRTRYVVGFRPAVAGDTKDVRIRVGIPGASAYVIRTRASGGGR